MAVLPPDAGLLVAAERHFDRGDVVVVDPAGAGLQPGDDPVGAGDVGREDAGGEAELGRVGVFDRLFLVAEGQDRYDRAEDFLPDDPPVVGAAVEDRRADDEAAGGSALRGPLAAAGAAG